MHIKPMLAKKYTGQEPKNYWLSEKLDGVRAIWNGFDFVSRNGNIFAAPDWYKQQMPAHGLDGELSLGRGQFDKTSGMVRSHNSNWNGLVYYIFDMPENLNLFEDRQASLNTLLLPSHCQIVKQIPCQGRKHLNEFKADIIDNGGEGVMLRKRLSPYEQKRSSFLLKDKAHQSTEATVIGYTDGEGKNNGLVGALVCKLDNGHTFKVGTGLTDAIRANPPKLDEVITINYFEITKKGVPRFPSYVGVRDYE